MKKLFLLHACSMMMLSMVSVAQSTSHCPNTDFEMGNFSGWLGYTGNCCPVTATIPGIIAGRHTILPAPQGTDYNTCNLLQITPAFVGGQVCRLGNDNIGSESERLVYSMTVDQYNALFVYRYAVVLEDPGHSPSEQPNFRIRVLDALGNVIDPVCGQYFVQAASNIPGFQTCNSVIWKDWTMVGISLTAYIGQTVTIEFTTSDCGLGAHFGYAYLDCFCMSMGISMEFCAGASSVTLTAPPGFPAYLWSTGATTQSIIIYNPVNQQVSCQLTTVQGCYLTLNATLHPTIITPSFTISGSPCNNPVHFNNTSTISYGNFSTWQWNFGDGSPIDTNQNPVHSYPSPGTYYVTLWAYSIAGCVDSITQPITIAVPPVADFSSTVVCQGSATSFSDLSVTSWSTITNWNWNFGDLATSTSQNPQHIYSSAGNYMATLIITTAAGCMDTIVHSVTVVPGPPIQTTPSQNICIGDSILLNASGAVSYVWSPCTYLSSCTASSVMATPPVSTSYIVTGTGSNGCTASAQVTVTVNPFPVLITSPATICAGQSTILTVSGANSYSWSPSNSLSSATGNPVTANPAVTTTYTVVGNMNGCTASTQVTVNVNPLPVVTASPNVTICAGQNSLLTVTGANTYTWSTAASLSSSTGNSVTANPAATTTYTVIGNLNGCTVSAQVTVNVNPLPVVTAAPNVTICTGQNSLLTVTGANTYSWSPAASLSASTGNSVTANPAVTTTYTVIGNLNGCTASAQVTVNVNPLPVVTAAPNATICAGQNSLLTANGANTYSWSPAASLSSNTGNSVTANPAVTTTYTVIGNLNGCTASAQVTVNVNPLPVVMASPNATICTGQNTLLTVTGANTYSWSPAASLSANTGNSVTANPVVTTTYTVIGNLNGCTASAQVTVNVNPLPVVTASPNATICAGQNSLLTANGANTYSWSPAASLSASTGDSVTVNPAVTTTYTVIGNLNGCTASTQVTVNVIPLPVLIVSPNIVICNGDTALLTVTGASTYLWSPFISLNMSNGDSVLVVPSATTTYTVTGNSNGCATSTQVTVTVNPVPVPSFVFQVTACTRITTFTNTSVNGSTYSWDFGDGNYSALQNPVHTYSTNNNYNVTLIVTGSNGCIDSAIVSIPVFFIPPVAGYASITPACSHTTVFTNQSSLATSYSWDFGDNTTSSLVNPVHDYQNMGNYVVKLVVSTPVGCKDSTVSPVVINPLPVAGYTSVIDTCSLHALFNSTSQYATSYLWDFGDNTFSNLPNPAHIYSTSGTYTVTLIVNDNNGCADTLVQTVSPHILSEAFYSYVIDSCAKVVNFMNQTSFAVGYLWDFGDGETSTDYSAAHHYAADGNYSVILIANPGTVCADTAEYIVDYHMGGVGDMWIPNAFTPNNDGKNDIFEVVGEYPCGDLTFTILARWGEVIYQTTQKHISWDGKYKGERVKQGVYVYMLEGEHYSKIGSITVMR